MLDNRSVYQYSLLRSHGVRSAEYIGLQNSIASSLRAKVPSTTDLKSFTVLKPPSSRVRVVSERRLRCCFVLHNDGYTFVIMSCPLVGSRYEIHDVL